MLWGGTVQVGTNDAYGNPLSGLTAWVNPSDPTDLRRLTASQAYDSQGNRIQSVDPHGKVSQTLYDQSGQPAAWKDRLGRVTSRIYDSQEREIQTILSTGERLETVFDENGRAVVLTHHHLPGVPATGTRFVYDAAGRQVRADSLEGVIVNVVTQQSLVTSVVISTGTVLSSKTNTYDAAGRLVAWTTQDGEACRLEFDAAGRLTADIDGLGNRTEYEYDQAGNRTLVRSPGGDEVRQVYDNMGRVVRTIFSDGASASTQYDDDNQRQIITDPTGAERIYQQNTLGQLLSVTLPSVPDPEQTNAPPDRSTSTSMTAWPT